MKHVIEVCEKCKREREQREANPKGGCAKCFYSSSSDKEAPCSNCFEEYTPFNHYPYFKEKE